MSEGWGLPSYSRKWHYFRGSRSIGGKMGSLCGKWMYINKKLLAGNDNSPNNCATCKKKLAKRKAKKQ